MSEEYRHSVRLIGSVSCSDFALTAVICSQLCIAAVTQKRAAFEARLPEVQPCTALRAA